MADEISCPYCESVFENKEDISKHIDRIHHGSGLLEGDSRKFYTLFCFRKKIFFIQNSNLSSSI